MKLIAGPLLAGVIAVQLFGPTTFAAQTRPAGQSGCALLDKNRPAQFITFEGVIEQLSLLTLRLRNNTNCSIIVETDDTGPLQPLRLPEGALRGRPAAAALSDVRLPLHYIVQDRQRRGAPMLGYGWGDSVYTYEIPAGQSVIFRVPLNHFKEGMDIAVPFNYGWESNKPIAMDVGGVVHRVYFLAEAVPVAALDIKTQAGKLTDPE